MGHEAYSLMNNTVVQLSWCGCLVFLIASCSNDDTPQPQTETPLILTTNQQQPVEMTNPLLIEDDAVNEDDTTTYRPKFSQSTPPEDDRWITFGSYRAPKPSSWFWIPPKSTFVATSYTLPGVEREDFASFTITQYEVDEGVKLDTNIQRWKALFRTYGGAPVVPVLNTLQINGKEASMVEIRGDYMGFSAAMHLRDHTLLVVVVEEETELFFFKILGPTATINAHRDDLLSLLDALEESLPTI